VSAPGRQGPSAPASDVAASHLYHSEDNRYHLASEQRIYDAYMLVGMLA